MRTKKLNKNVPENVLEILENCPNFHHTGSITGVNNSH